MRAAWAWLGCVACGANGAALDPSVEELCDGSAGTRLAVTSYGGMMEPMTEFLQPWGYDWLQVDGACQWYVGVSDGPQGQWTPVSTGELSSEAAEALLTDLQVASWPAFAATADNRQVPDGGTFVVHYAGATWEGVGDLGRLDEVRDAMLVVREGLIEGGAPLVADRVLVQVIEADGGWQPDHWDVAPPEAGLAALAAQVPAFSGEGVAREGARAAPWRAMLDGFVREADTRRAMPYATEAEQGYFLMVREEPGLLRAAEL